MLTVGTSFGSVIAMTTTGSSGVDSDAYTVGWAFSSTTISVSALGYYAAGANGLSNSHTVGIYTSTGTLLRSTTVPSGTTGTLTSNYRMTSVTPLILGPGNYVVAGLATRPTTHFPSEPP